MKYLSIILTLLSSSICFAHRDLETGIFLPRDPIGHSDGPSVYCYVNCNPIYAVYEAYEPRPFEWSDGTTGNPDRQMANTKDEEAELGLLNEGLRYRDLETGTFLTRDPIGYADGPNMYCYVHCNPITNFDPLGLKLRISGNGDYKEQYIFENCLAPLNEGLSIDEVTGYISIEEQTEMKCIRHEAFAGYLNRQQTGYINAPPIVASPAWTEAHEIDSTDEIYQALKEIINSDNIYTIEVSAKNTFYYEPDGKRIYIPEYMSMVDQPTIFTKEEGRAYISYASETMHELGHALDDDRRPLVYDTDKMYLPGYKDKNNLEGLSMKYENLARKRLGERLRQSYENDMPYQYDPEAYKRIMGTDPVYIEKIDPYNPYENK